MAEQLCRDFDYGGRVGQSRKDGCALSIRPHFLRIFPDLRLPRLGYFSIAAIRRDGRTSSFGQYRQESPLKTLFQTTQQSQVGTPFDITAGAYHSAPGGKCEI